MHLPYTCVYPVKIVIYWLLPSIGSVMLASCSIVQRGLVIFSMLPLSLFSILEATKSYHTRTLSTQLERRKHPLVLSQCSESQTETLGCWNFETVLISKRIDMQMLFTKPDIYYTMVSDQWHKGKAYLYKTHLIIPYEILGQICFFFLVLEN